MCGIVGYVGKERATNFLLDGLSKLEYRGYDSAGIAVVNNGKVTVVKHKGRLANLEKDLGQAVNLMEISLEDTIKTIQNSKKELQ